MKIIRDEAYQTSTGWIYIECDCKRIIAHNEQEWLVKCSSCDRATTYAWLKGGEDEESNS